MSLRVCRLNSPGTGRKWEIQWTRLISRGVGWAVAAAAVERVTMPGEAMWSTLWSHLKLVASLISLELLCCHAYRFSGWYNWCWWCWCMADIPDILGLLRVHPTSRPSYALPLSVHPSVRLSRAYNVQIRYEIPHDTSNHRRHYEARRPKAKTRKLRIAVRRGMSDWTTRRNDIRSCDARTQVHKTSNSVNDSLVTVTRLCRKRNRIEDTESLPVRVKYTIKQWLRQVMLVSVIDIS